MGTRTSPISKLVDGILFINVGSVGKPKDGDRRACYAILDTKSVGTQFVRVEYDVAVVAAAIRQSELPHAFATDLEVAGASVGR